MKTALSLTLATVAAALTGLATPVQAQSFAPIDISSGQPGWLATHNGATGNAFTFTNRCSTFSPCMSVSSTGYADGVLVDGLPASAFNGRWVASLDFQVPPHNGRVRLDLLLEGVDDRATFRLNGVPLLVALRQDGTQWAMAVVDGPLRAGQSNRLEVVNNPARNDGRALPFQGPNDGTGLSFSGVVTAQP